MRIEYTENELILTISTACPAATHRSIVKGLVASLKLKILSNECSDSESEGLAALAELLQKMVPSEIQFEKAFGPAT